MVRFNVVVVNKTGDEPEHTHVREKGIRPGKIEDVFRSVVADEYDRMLRFSRGNDAPIESEGSISSGLVVATMGDVMTRVYTEEVK